MSFQKKIPISSISPHASTFQNGLRSFLGLSYELDYYDLVVYSLGLQYHPKSLKEMPRIQICHFKFNFYVYINITFPAYFVSCHNLFTGLKKLAKSQKMHIFASIYYIHTYIVYLYIAFSQCQYLPKYLSTDTYVLVLSEPMQLACTESNICYILHKLFVRNSNTVRTPIVDQSTIFLQDILGCLLIELSAGGLLMEKVL